MYESRSECFTQFTLALHWCHNGRDGASNHQPHDCLFNCLFGCRSKKTSKLRVTGLCAGKSPVNGEFPAQMTSNAENVFNWWRHNDHFKTWYLVVSILGIPIYSDQLKRTCFPCTAIWFACIFTFLLLKASFGLPLSLPAFVCVRPCASHGLVRTITRDLQGQISLQNQIIPNS